VDPILIDRIAQARICSGVVAWPLWRGAGGLKGLKMSCSDPMTLATTERYQRLTIADLKEAHAKF
jgi:hypothetical protein